MRNVLGGGGLLARWRGTAAAPAAAAVDLSERRRDVRQTIIFQVAKITADGHEELCVLRDISPGGVRAEIYWPIALDTRLTIELKSGHQLDGHVVWARDSQIGVKFAAELQGRDILAYCSVDERVGQARAPRLDCVLPTTLRCVEDPADELPAEIRNVSQAGLMIATDRAFPAETRLDVLLDHFGWRRGVVRWSRDGALGVLLEHMIDYGDFALWRRQLRETAAVLQPRRRRALLHVNL